MAHRRYDVIIIGSGSGGEGAAMKIAKAGKSVAIVERHHDVGGGCTHWGTIPSKALRHSVQQLADYRNDAVFRRLVGPIDFTYPQLLASAETVIRQQTRMREGHYHRNQVDILPGVATFVDANTVSVTSSDDREQLCCAEHFIIATGSRPYRPPEIDFSHPRVHDSDTIVQPGITPRSITIYGAGVVGCEYASIFGNLGLKVNLVNTRERLLAFLDGEITDALGYQLRDKGVVIRHNEEFDKVELRDDSVVLHCKSGKRFKSDFLLWANGRSGNSLELGLEAIGVSTDHRGQIKINENYQTAQEHIYAVGDVVGLPSLASASYDQGRFAATHLVEGKCDSTLIENIPTASIPARKSVP